MRDDYVSSKTSPLTEVAFKSKVKSHKGSARVQSLHQTF